MFGVKIFVFVTRTFWYFLSEKYTLNNITDLTEFKQLLFIFQVMENTNNTDFGMLS